MDLSDYYTLVTNIKYYRKINEITQEQLAEKAELSVSYIKQLESCKRFKNITVKSLSKIAKALNVDIDVLFKDNPKTKELIH